MVFISTTLWPPIHCRVNVYINCKGLTRKYYWMYTEDALFCISRELYTNLKVHPKTPLCVTVNAPSGLMQISSHHILITSHSSWVMGLYKFDAHAKSFTITLPSSILSNLSGPLFCEDYFNRWRTSYSPIYVIRKCAM